MNAYQEKWIEVLSNAHIKDWKIEPQDNDIAITLPQGTQAKTVLENLPDVVATLSLDITVPKERLKFVLKSGQEVHDYVLNPTDEDLSTAKRV
ncbi:hypothetical protein HH214_16930 [Mucilaginibacter robiniae]|uniref:Uncharacterized protein n=1 Tax=Mucilaginibacter robiniae TaxID=2728022 RepID=A0A7L5E6P2_9SPHI|nr:hypothetical protein [Mucilaginibacter robiniae]QJD97434.1 hypothetical protein HH214_16930 [Mucilaginibacter robiniae]